MNEFESKCYGMSQSEIKRQYMEGFTAQMSGLEMVVAGLLSDAQELMSFDTVDSIDQARKELNKAKYILFEMLDAKQKELA